MSGLDPGRARVRVAAHQINPLLGRKAENLRRILQAIRETPSQLAVFPECAPTGYGLMKPFVVSLFLLAACSNTADNTALLKGDKIEVCTRREDDSTLLRCDFDPIDTRPGGFSVLAIDGKSVQDFKERKFEAPPYFHSESDIRSHEHTVTVDTAGQFFKPSINLTFCPNGGHLYEIALIKSIVHVSSKTVPFTSWPTIIDATDKTFIHADSYFRQAQPPADAGGAPVAPTPPQAATEENRRSAIQYWNQGISYYQKGDYAAAKNAWVQCKQFDPANSDCVDGLRRIDQQLRGP